MTTNRSCATGSSRLRKLTRPDRIHWCNGSDIERDELIQQMLGTGRPDRTGRQAKPSPGATCNVEPLGRRTRRAPHLHLHAGEGRRRPDHQLDGAACAAHARITHCSASCIGRTMYVVPYCISTINSPHSRCSIEITDGLCRAQYADHDWRWARRRCTASAASAFVKGLRSIGDLVPTSASHHPLPRGLLDQEHRFRAMAATRCLARSAMPCASQATGCARRRLG